MAPSTRIPFSYDTIGSVKDSISDKGMKGADAYEHLVKCLGTMELWAVPVDKSISTPYFSEEEGAYDFKQNLTDLINRYEPAYDSLYYKKLQQPKVVPVLKILRSNVKGLLEEYSKDVKNAINFEERIDSMDADAVFKKIAKHIYKEDHIPTEYLKLIMNNSAETRKKPSRNDDDDDDNDDDDDKDSYESDIDLDSDRFANDDDEMDDEENDYKEDDEDPEENEDDEKVYSTTTETAKKYPKVLPKRIDNNIPLQQQPSKPKEEKQPQPTQRKRPALSTTPSKNNKKPRGLSFIIEETKKTFSTQQSPQKKRK